MRILIVTNVYPSEDHPYHGIFVFEQVQAIRENHPDADFDIYYINGFKGKWQYIKSIWNVRKLINNNSYDIVHIHYGFAGLFLLSPFVKKTPLITTFHGSDIQPKGGNGWFSIFVSRIAAKHSDASIVLNEDMELMVKPYCSKTYQVPCAVDINTFKPMGNAQKHNKYWIIFPSNHERKVKNYPLFCKVLGILKDEYKIEAEERELKNLSREEIATLYTSSNLLLMTSDSEGSPQVVKEALSCNLPCVSTPVGDVKILLDGVKDCYVATSHNAEEIAALSARALLHRGDGLSGREKVLQLKIDKKSIADKVYDIYMSLI